MTRIFLDKNNQSFSPGISGYSVLYFEVKSGSIRARIEFVNGDVTEKSYIMSDGLQELSLPGLKSVSFISTTDAELEYRLFGIVGD